MSAMKLPNSGAWFVESVRSDLRAIFLRLLVTRPATEGGENRFQMRRSRARSGKIGASVDGA